uniref:VIT domain-containing protein n=1 Tax=Cyprinus carpio TaxID=7962 RepID=A0A8C1GTB0_CYPCA
RMENCGLLSEKNVPVPLKSISVQVLVQDHVATVSSTLQYVNEEERPLEALFVFPLPADAAVCHFSAKIGEQEIVAEVQDRETARDRYDDAVSSGQQAFLLEESSESPDVFRLSVGCLSAGQNAAVTIIYVTELAVQDDHSLRFCLPAVLNPRYTPAGSAAGIVSEISSGAVPYTLTLSVHGMCCLCVQVNLSPGHMFDKDVELFVYYQDTHQPSAILEAGVTTAPPGSLMRDTVVMISLYPEFPEEVMSSLASRGEFVFVIDRSGSMGDMMHHGKGAQMRIESAKVRFNLGFLTLLIHVHSHRCFSFGIGEGASAALITGMAREGSGHAQFITDTDRMQPKVKLSTGFHRFALQPAVLNISVDWTLPDEVTVDTLSPPINVLFQGQRTLIYAQLKGEGTVTVKYSLKDQPVTNQLSIHRLAARTLIRSLEQEERSGAADVEGIRSRMVELSVQAGVSSVHTAFIAVNKDSRQTVKDPCCREECQHTVSALIVCVHMCVELTSFRYEFFLKEDHAYSPASTKQQQNELNYNCYHLESNKLVFEGLNLLLQLVSLQKASGCWDLDATLADVFGKTEDELTNQKPAQVDGSVWATLLALIWLYGCKIEQQVEWQFVAMKAASWIGSQKGEISIPDHIHSVSVHQETFQQISSVL